MSMTAAFLFMEDNRARLAFQPQTLFGSISRALKGRCRDRL